MPRLPTWPALALLGALLCLAACTPTAAVNVSPAATKRPWPPAPTPTNIPAGWKVLATTRFSIAYPPDWTLEPLTDEPQYEAYAIDAPAQHSRVLVEATPEVDAGELRLAFCVQHAKFANLPMTYRIAGLADTLRQWQFANTQRTLYSLQALDTQADAATQAENEAVLGTFRPDNADPWSC